MTEKMREEIRTLAEETAKKILYHQREATLSKTQCEVIITEALLAHGNEVVESAAQVAEERATISQGSIDLAKSKMEKDGHNYHQQHIWEFQALRDEANLISKLIREKLKVKP